MPVHEGSVVSPPAAPQTPGQRLYAVGDTPPCQPPHAPGEPDPGDASGGALSEPVAIRRVRLTPVAGIALRPTRWVWEGRIPHGALTLGAGREGVGKSLFCAWLAAQLTTGTLPGVYFGSPRSVVCAASEDSWERTIAGRLHVAGADLERVYRIEVEHLTGGTVPLCLPRDCVDLGEQVRTHEIALLILDPLMSTIDARINVNQEELRTALEPLAGLADATGMAVFGLVHFNKTTGTDVLSRITGSRAFAAVARAALGFARDPHAGDGSCVLSQVKNNLGRLDVPSLRYHVEPTTLTTPEGTGHWGRLILTGETTTHVETLLADADPDDGDRDELDAWLRTYLTDQGGTAPANDIIRQGRALGFSRDQLKRAKQRLHITSTKTTGWAWQLPDTHPSTTPDAGTERDTNPGDLAGEALGDLGIFPQAGPHPTSPT